MSILPVLPELAAGTPTHIADHRHRDVGDAAGAAAGPGAGAACAASLRAARCAGMGGAVPRSLATRCGRLRRERAVAEPARGLPGAGDSDDADQRTAVRPQPGTMAAGAGTGAADAGRFHPGAAAQRDRRGAAARAWLLPRGQAGRSEARRAAAAGRRGGGATATRDGGRPAGLARREHPSGGGGRDPCRPSRDWRRTIPGC